MSSLLEMLLGMPKRRRKKNRKGRRRWRKMVR